MMTKEDFFGRILRAAARVGIIGYPDQAMLMAMVEQESFHAGLPTSLAADFKNLMGFKWQDPGDKGRYEFIEFHPNEFETALGMTAKIRYRIYESFEHCILNWDWHRWHSTIYTEALQEYQKHLAEGKQAACRVWLIAMSKEWDQTNPNDEQELGNRYDKWISRLQGA